MILIEETNVWNPTRCHGTLPLTGDRNIEAIVAAGLKASIVPNQIPFYTTIKYCTQYNLDGSQSLFFEVLS